MSRVPDEFTLSGKTTPKHIVAGEPRDPGHCAEKLAVADAWKERFGSLPKAVYVDRERIKVKDQNKWFWGPPSEEMVHNLTALDNGQRRACKAHSWEIWMIKKSDVIPMSEEKKEELKNYESNRKSPQEREPTVRRRIGGLTRMVPRSSSR
jgi:hypothetical protein